VNYEPLNLYGLDRSSALAGLLSIGLFCAGFAEFIAGCQRELKNSSQKRYWWFTNPKRSIGP
jgi:hypothetical protein